MISYIVAMDEAGVIGKNNQLPWHISSDLKRFKKITMGHPIVMGRKTFQSIGKPLPGRENIILTRDENFHCPGCTVFHNFNQLLSYCLEKDKEVFVIGGSSLFQLFLSYVDRLYITKIYHRFNGDVIFPDIDWNQFVIVEREEGVDDAFPYRFEYILYTRKEGS